MKLFYSIGGGLGHLTRFSSVIRSLKIDEPVTLVASSPFARDPRVVDSKHRVIIPPFWAARSKESLTEWFQKLIDEEKPEEVYIDAFPAGILGELNQVFFADSTRLFTLARILKWNVYAERIPNFRLAYEKAFVLEPLAHEHMEFLHANAKQVEELKLLVPVLRPEIPPTNDNTWLLIHSGPDPELKMLLKQVEKDAAQQKDCPEIIIVYPGKRPDFVSLDYKFINLYPAFEMFETAGRVYSGAGFNMIHQMLNYQNRHHVMPFERILDNQFARVELHKSKLARVLSSADNEEAESAAKSQYGVK